jgi:HNH endonuclease
VPQAIDLFLSKISPYKSETDCWIWKGLKAWGQYGRFEYKKKSYIASRWIYEYYFGTIPTGLVLDHLCRVKLCVNPYHLEAVDNATNILRGEIFNRNKTHCKRGHEFTEENTHIYTNYKGVLIRICKICRKISSKKTAMDKKVENNYTKIVEILKEVSRTMPKIRSGRNRTVGFMPN